MMNLEFRTQLSQEDVIERLKHFFGKDGLGLEIKDETPQCLYLNVALKREMSVLPNLSNAGFSMFYG